MRSLGLVSGFLLVFTLQSSLARPQKSADGILWTGQQDPANLIPAELGAQGVVLPTDPANIMLVRRPKGGARRKQVRLRQPDLDRQLKADGNDTLAEGSNNSTGGGLYNVPNTKQLPPRVNHLIGPNGNQLIRTGVALLGAALGHEGCDLKAACLAAAMVPPMQGRDVVVLAAEAIVPQGWRKIYDAAKKSIIQKQDCDRFTCL